jgi:antitoxin MazE
MRLRIVRVGNSRGIRVPKALLDEARVGPDAEFDARVTPDGILLAPARTVRLGWAEAATRLHAEGCDALIDTPSPKFDTTEWTW